MYEKSLEAKHLRAFPYREVERWPRPSLRCLGKGETSSGSAERDTVGVAHKNSREF